MEGETVSMNQKGIIDSLAESRQRQLSESKALEKRNIKDTRKDKSSKVNIAYNTKSGNWEAY
jgi:hypothetical protein